MQSVYTTFDQKKYTAISALLLLLQLVKTLDGYFLQEDLPNNPLSEPTFVFAV